MVREPRPVHRRPRGQRAAGSPRKEHPMRAWTAPLLALLAGLLMAGCAAAARESPPVFSEPSVGFDQAAEGGFPGESFAPGQPGVAEAPVLVSNVAAVERVVIQTASLTLVVPDPAASADEIADLAAEMGGFVVSSNNFPPPPPPHPPTSHPPNHNLYFLFL